MSDQSDGNFGAGTESTDDGRDMEPKREQLGDLADYPDPINSIMLAEDLHFCPTSNGKDQFDDVYLSNTTSKHVGFKIKITTPGKYRVAPPFGNIEPKGKFKVRITLLEGEAVESKDKFLVQFSKIEKWMTPFQTEDLISRISKRKPGARVLSCRLASVKTKTVIREVPTNKDRDASSAPPSKRRSDEADLLVSQQRLRQKLERIERNNRMYLCAIVALVVLLFVAASLVMAGDIMGVMNQASHGRIPVIKLPRPIVRSKPVAVYVAVPHYL